LLCRNVSGSLLIDDQRNVHGVKQLMDRIGLRDDEGFAQFNHAAPQIRYEGFLAACVRSRSLRRF